MPDGDLRSSWAHCRDIALTAEKQGFRNILAPSSYQVGHDTLSYVAGMAPLTDKINFLAAIRCGEMQPIMLARTIATLDHMLKGRLTLNVISSDFPGEVAPSPYRYKRSHEVVQILRQAWTQDEINHEGEIYQFSNVPTGPATPYQDQLAERMKAVHARAAAHGRTLDYGLRVHMIVRDTEAEAKDYAEFIASKLDDDYGKLIRDRAHDSISLGVAHQAKARELADKYGYTEPGLWTGVGRARSGCGAALVGSTDQVMSKIEEYQKMGIRAFIFSGYPHIDEAEHFGSRVMPHIKTCSLPHAYGRVPAEPPATPLGTGPRT